MITGKSIYPRKEFQLYCLGKRKRVRNKYYIDNIVAGK